MIEFLDAFRPTKAWPVIGDSTIIYILFTNYTSMFLVLLMSYFVGSLLAGNVAHRLVTKHFKLVQEKKI